MFKLREATEIDAETLSAIHEECFPNYWNPSEFSDFFSVSGTFALLASPSPLEGEGGVGGKTRSDVGARFTPPPSLPPQGGEELFVAMIVYRVQFEQADIITLAVRPDFRRQGMARAMVERALEHMARLGAKQIFLDVEDGNLAAIGLYEGLGFSHERRRKLYYRQKDGSYTDALVMKKKIA